jgi:hypothetical protein
MTLEKSLSQLGYFSKSVFEFTAEVLGVLFVQSVFGELLDLLENGELF